MLHKSVADRMASTVRQQPGPGQALSVARMSSLVFSMLMEGESDRDRSATKIGLEAEELARLKRDGLQQVVR